MTLQEAIARVASRRDLSADETAEVVGLIMQGEATPAQIGGLLIGLRMKGETPAELAGAARAMRARATPIRCDAAVVVDTCGTGGDGAATINISTIAAFVVAAAGVTVAKHGNRAVTSKAGSADVLEALGIPIELAPADAARWLDRHGFAFFFAPLYHPAFKHIIPARKLCSTRGVRTIFNFLGPLLNPAQPTAQLIGVPRPELCEPLAQALKQLGARRGMVVCGRAGAGWLDEFSPMGETHVAEFNSPQAVATSEIQPSIFPAQPGSLADLEGGDAQTNAGIIRAILSGAERGPKRDAVLLNAAAALNVAGVARRLTDGWALAAGLIDGGTAKAKLDELVAAGKGQRATER